MPRLHLRAGRAHCGQPEIYSTGLCTAWTDSEFFAQVTRAQVFVERWQGCKPGFCYYGEDWVLKISRGTIRIRVCSMNPECEVRKSFSSSNIGLLRRERRLTFPQLFCSVSSFNQKERDSRGRRTTSTGDVLLTSEFGMKRERIFIHSCANMSLRVFGAVSPTFTYSARQRI
jgi:hypothetical protein